MTDSQNYSGKLRWTKYIFLVYPISLIDLKNLRIMLNLTESMPASTTTVLSLKGYQFDWIWLNQSQPALQLYWISEALSLADSVWIMDSQYQEDRL